MLKIMWLVKPVKHQCFIALVFVQLALLSWKDGAAGQGWSKPEMLPWPESGSRDIFINEGELLELKCTSRHKMKLYYPTDVPDEEIKTSLENIEEKEYHDDEKNEKRKVSIFRRTNSVHGDTGWYGCGSIEALLPETAGIPSDSGANSSDDYYGDPYITWIYVFVKSNSSYFVQGDSFKSFRKTLGGTATIPCRPTWPEYPVKLVKEYTEIEMGGRASYDPRIGFKLSNITLKDSSYFTCSITQGDDKQESTFHLSVIRNQELTEPRIVKDTLRHVTKGQTLHVNCTTDVDTDIQHTFNWTTPVQSARITTRQYSNPIATNKETITCELIINGVIDEDQGDYECTITSFVDTKKATAFIAVYDPDIKYINLTSEDSNRFYEKNYNDKVEWFVSVDAYPQPTLKWFDPQGIEIVGSWTEPVRSKYAIETLSSSTLLRINRLELRDIGIYSLQATNEHQIETLNFTLEVIVTPIIVFEAPIEAYYMQGKTFNFYSKVVGFPAPAISWSFFEAPNYPSMEGSRLINLENATMVDPKPDHLFRSVLTTAINWSGILTCEACNKVGCDSISEPIIVSDVSGGFGIIRDQKMELLTKGDDAKLTCAASIYNFTRVEWLDGNNNTLIQTDHVSTIQSQTDFTYRSDLIVKNIDTFDNGTLYHCIGYKNEDHDFNDSSEYRFEIYDPVVPYLVETNMNKTEITLDLSTEGHKTTILKCYAEGTPLPNVTWYKDDERIRSNDQYMCLHRNQELHIKYLLDENNGKYVCRAENRFGKVTNYQILLIRGKEVSKIFIILIVALVIICILLVVYFSIKMHREKVMRKELMEAGLTHFEEGALECLNPDLTVDDQAELLPYDKKWEFPREKLKFGKQLGFGAFGVVMKAEASGIYDDETVTTVAVKMVRRTTESTYIRALASELKIMVHLGKHLNVVNLLGACTKNITKRELLVIVEYCRFGNLHNYLFRHRANFINQIDASSGEIDPTIGLEMLGKMMTNNSSPNEMSLTALENSRGTSVPERVSYDASTARIDTSQLDPSCNNSLATNQPGWRSNYTGDYKDHNLKPICTQDLLSWAFQVARGMEYLSQRKVLHGDLAARNILLAENNVVKICDFGLAKTMYKDDNYKKKGDAPLPIKWMAIESIRDRVFSTQSDIWSFGIVLWEFFTLAKTPYPGMEAEKQYQRLVEGYRMEQPEYATDQVYNIMLKCWKAKPALRPTFTNLAASIGDLLESSVKEHYVDLNAPYLDMNTITLESGKSDYLTMMSAPDHDGLTSPSSDYVNSPCLSSVAVESAAVAAKTTESNSDSESEFVELSPMLKRDYQDNDNYEKPINVHERRAEFARQREAARIKAEKKKIEQSDEGKDIGYCNTPKDLHLIDLNGASELNRSQVDGKTLDNPHPKEGYVPSIIKTQDNYVNMPRQKNSIQKDGQVSYSNPSYVIMGNNQNLQT